MARQYFRPVFLICLSSLMVYALPSAAEYRCKKDGYQVIQESPCADAAAPTGKFRCFVDGEVIYSAVSCTSIKSKAVLAQEASARDAENIRHRRAQAAVLEAADRPNFSRRILMAQQVTANHLLDPDSARFGTSTVSWYSGSAAVCGMVSGRNSFGGYARPVRFVTIDDWVTLDDAGGMTEFDAVWKKYCGPN